MQFHGEGPGQESYTRQPSQRSISGVRITASIVIHYIGRSLHESFSENKTSIQNLHSISMMFTVFSCRSYGTEFGWKVSFMRDVNQWYLATLRSRMSVQTSGQCVRRSCSACHSLVFTCQWSYRMELRMIVSSCLFSVSHGQWPVPVRQMLRIWKLG